MSVGQRQSHGKARQGSSGLVQVRVVHLEPVGWPSLILHSRARSAPVKFMFQQRGYVKVRIGGDMEALLDQAMNACSIDFAEWNEESGQRGVEVSRHQARA